MNYPKISIITPSFNQGQFLEATILSVLNQNYPNLEYIIIDGGSTDNSIEIIKKYDKQITNWVSEKDNGQVDAINKGFRKVTGDIVCWLNSDDMLTDNTLKIIAKEFENNNTTWLTGDCIFIDEKGRELKYIKADIPDTCYDWLNLFVRGKSYAFIQPSTFWSRSVFEKVGLLNEKYNYSFDHEFFYRVFKSVGTPTNLPISLSNFRFHIDSKSMIDKRKFIEENFSIGSRNFKDISFIKRVKLHFLLLKSYIYFILNANGI